ncbi:SLOG family protein [Novisyntrophococcus fermenticellae]|uniref:SLOG family protein n=1 Tax=Novisyntrophococcus fermenticellae TaxID=2068655 RepID=UPI001E30A96C|nr:SLOG family protein [Novisyntrophococcus fermenticellae]
MEKTAAFIGPRVQKFQFGSDEKHPDCIQIKKDLQETVISLYQNTGTYQFLCGTSFGFEIWAAEILVGLKEEYLEMELHCIEPYAGHTENWSIPRKERYAYILQNATGMYQLGVDKHYVSCYKEQKEFLIEHADTIISVSGRHIKPGGGSAQIINLAREKGKRTIFVT